MVKKAKYTKVIPIRLTDEQWVKIQTSAHNARLDPSVFIRKVVLDRINGGE